MRNPIRWLAWKLALLSWRLQREEGDRFDRLGCWFEDLAWTYWRRIESREGQ